MTDEKQLRTAIIFLVRNTADEWIEIEGHQVIVQDGALLIYKGVLMGEGPESLAVLPAGFFAPGQWLECTTDYEGEKPEGIIVH